jgi:hypothetical protein
VSIAWTNAFVVLSMTHMAEFEAAITEIADPCCATAVPYPFLRVRLRDVADEVLLLLALSRCGQEYRVGPGLYGFPAEWEEEVRETVAFHCLRASVVPSVCYRLELRRAGMLDNLRSALLARTPTFGPSYPKIAA